MTEAEYILITNLTKVRGALDILRGVCSVEGYDFFVDGYQECFEALYGISLTLEDKVAKIDFICQQ